MKRLASFVASLLVLSFLIPGCAAPHEPPAGAYFFRTVGYLAFNKGEPIAFDLLFILVGEGEGSFLGHYEQASLVDSRGHEYAAELEGALTPVRGTGQMALGRVFASGLTEDTTIVAMVFKSGEERIRREVGKLEIDILDEEEGQSNWIKGADRIAAGLAAGYSASVYNRSNEEAVVTAVGFGPVATGVFEGGVVNPNSVLDLKVTLNYDRDLPQGKSFQASPVFYTVKPVFTVAGRAVAARTQTSYCGGESMGEEELKKFLSSRS